MLVLYRQEQRWEDRRFEEFPSFLAEGDCLIVNNSRVFPSRLFGRKASGTARVEVFLIRAVSDDKLSWEALVRPGRKLPVGEKIEFDNGIMAEVLDRSEHGERIIRFLGVEGDIYDALQQIGHVPLPPYIRRQDTADDRQRYQTVYARPTGSVAAPTAGLHFTPEILDQCRSKGAALAEVTLHVGLGTFQPLHVEHVVDVRLHSEQYDMNLEALDTMRAAKRRIAVGTTSVRTTETVYRTGKLSGDTDLFISPGFGFQAVDAMLTNFHLPQSSLLMLVSALAGTEFVLSAYRHAVEEKYRFFSYGDCMLIL
jgi:S-adenosylmethionine:tRNA ribosyltransferase-isomerase